MRIGTKLYQFTSVIGRRAKAFAKLAGRLFPSLNLWKSTTENIKGKTPINPSKNPPKTSETTTATAVGKQQLQEHTLPPVNRSNKPPPVNRGNKPKAKTHLQDGKKPTRGAHLKSIIPALQKGSLARADGMAIVVETKTELLRADRPLNDEDLRTLMKSSNLDDLQKTEFLKAQLQATYNMKNNTDNYSSADIEFAKKYHVQVPGMGHIN